MTDLSKKYPVPLDDEDFMNAGSCGDCTGLIPAEITNEQELENYNSLYEFLPHAQKREH
jgi:hypothetical protein